MKQWVVAGEGTACPQGLSDHPRKRGGGKGRKEKWAWLPLPSRGPVAKILTICEEPRQGHFH